MAMKDNYFANNFFLPFYSRANLKNGCRDYHEMVTYQRICSWGCGCGVG